MTRLPLLGAMARGLPAAAFDEPLRNPGFVHHQPVVWPLVGLGAVVLVMMLWPVAKRWRPLGAAHSRFPPYGVFGAALVAASWAVSWGTRIPYTFTPLWVGYILTASAVSKWRTGRALLDDPRRLLALTALSAVFWWFFEYQNRFVESWEYHGITVAGWREAVVFGVLPFATVLPAVAATQPLFESSAFEKWLVVSPPHSRLIGAAVALSGLLGLFALSWAPTVLYPLVWLAPLLVLCGGQAALGKRHVFSDLVTGDWRGLVSWALAALVCGFFWELWNWHAWPKWTYAVSYVGEPKLFEMPALGYAGYLFFGWECAAVAALTGERR